MEVDPLDGTAGAVQQSPVGDDERDLRFVLGLHQHRESRKVETRYNEIKEATILNRVVRWTADGLEHEADPR